MDGAYELDARRIEPDPHKPFTVCIEETVSKNFTVFADTAEQAMQIAEENYKSGAFVLCPGDVTARQMAVTHPSSKVTEWTAF